MPRDWNIWGPALVKVRFGAHLSGAFVSGGGGAVPELGLTDGSIEVRPAWKHLPIVPDDFSLESPPEMMWDLLHVDIRTHFIHYDDDVLDTAIAESTAGGNFIPGPFGNTATAGQLAPRGMLMGRNQFLYASGCHYMGVNVLPPSSGMLGGWGAFPAKGYRFLSCYLLSEPFVQKIGDHAGLAECTWRCIPYRPYSLPGVPNHVSGTNFGELSSSGIVLWDRNVDS